MTPLTSALAAIRFGYGLHPGQRPPDGPQALIAQLRDARNDAAPAGPAVDDRMAMLDANFKARRMRRRNEAGADEAIKEASRALVGTVTEDSRRLVARAVGSEAGFFERLAMFWTDHFAIEAGNRRRAVLTHDMIERAIRPNLTGSFGDLLKAVTKHPAMLVYLNQARSTGPNSIAGKRGKRGLNENLAREVLELHTVGVDAGYTQKDVREFAELLTGLGLDEDGFRFRPQLAEPGAETVLGARYGGGKANVADVDRALEDLALHPQTARHLARKLWVHFIGGVPEPSRIDALARVYLDEGGGLMPLYRALVDEPRAWELPLLKAKLPFDFVVSSLRALGTAPREVTGLNRRQFEAWLTVPMMRMGQPFLEPGGPDGFPEAPEAWITPAGLAARVSWAGALAQERARDRDPREFLETALGPVAPELLRRAVAGAETRHEGVALVLASPEFNRR
ncbi:DUF1800 domain-containing protein [Halovulum marinum]|nr:DUF1800 domain-containing protein [Halovulum marinum]